VYVNRYIFGIFWESSTLGPSQGLERDTVGAKMRIAKIENEKGEARKTALYCLWRMFRCLCDFPCSRCFSLR